MALIKCRYCGHQMSDKAEQCPKCGKKTNIECELVDTTRSEAENNYDNVSTKNHSVNKIFVSVLILLAIGLGGVSGYFLHSKTSANNESALDEAETTDTVMTNEDLLKDGYYYWLLPNQFPIVYELKDGVIKNAYINYYPLEAKISHKEYFKGRNTQTLPNGQKMDLYIQFKLKNGDGYVEQGGSRTDITMYKVCIPSDAAKDILQFYKNNYEGAMRNAQSDVVDEAAAEVAACDSVSVDY